MLTDTEDQRLVRQIKASAKDLLKAQHAFDVAVGEAIAEGLSVRGPDGTTLSFRDIRYSDNFGERVRSFEITCSREETVDLLDG